MERCFLSEMVSASLRTLQSGVGCFGKQPGGLDRVYFELLRHLPDPGFEARGLLAGGV